MAEEFDEMGAEQRRGRYDELTSPSEQRSLNIRKTLARVNQQRHVNISRSS